MFDRFYYSGDVDKAIKRAASESRTEFAWVLHQDVDYSNFDLRWLPNKHEREQSHAWGSHSNPNSYTTWLLPKKSSSVVNYHNQVLPVSTPLPKIMHDNISIDGAYQLDISDEWTWLCDSRVDYSDFDFSWMPDHWDRNVIHCMGMKNQRDLSYTWLVNSSALHSGEFKYHDSSLTFAKPIEKIWLPDLTVNILSGRDWMDSLANWVLEQGVTDEWVWVCDSRVDYSDFDFSWMPPRWDTDYIHCFEMKGRTQISYTWLVNTRTLSQKQFKYYESDLEFLESPFEFAVLDFGNGHKHMTTFKRIRFVGNMIDVISNAVRRSKSEWLWICSSISNYEGFDFWWLPTLDQISHTHCWPAMSQEKGETFLIHVPTYLRTGEFVFNFDHRPINRFAWPGVIYEEDNLAEAISNNPPTSLYTLYYKKNSSINHMPYPCLWEDRPVIGMCEGNSVSLVPRDCTVKSEIYEYPFLDQQHDLAQRPQLDVVFIHNGEFDAMLNLQTCYQNCPVDMEVRISSGVNGRLKAYQAAADMSNTDWFLAVFAKCHMKDDFANFTWRPDYWQKPKHYIFHNHNYDLNLTYGHMAPIAYNKKLMMENKGGLDMTLAQDHAVIPVVLSETRLTDPWDTWRTAFRETVKLMYYAKTDNGLELHYRLHKWLTAEEVWTKHNPWYQLGSQDAKDFFESVDGDWGWIMLTSEWDWLRKRFDALYPKSKT